MVTSRKSSSNAVEVAAPTTVPSLPMARLALLGSLLATSAATANAQFRLAPAPILPSGASRAARVIANKLAVRVAGGSDRLQPGQNSAALMSGLCAGIPYVFGVTAARPSAKGSPSLPSNPVAPLPAQPPNAPVIVLAEGRPDSLVLPSASARLPAPIRTARTTSRTTRYPAPKGPGLTLLRRRDGATRCWQSWNRAFSGGYRSWL